ncbi:MAG TPA: VOC family protein [Trebonia sp.]|jgi:catechol 2,3-dioxygenase-like lactoylglutathione lyase family enzyme|nr:VOC family protein [Trebonia sp.]
MRPKIFFITLAVDDLDRSVAFYRDGLGWPTDGIVGREFHDEVTGADGTIAFFSLDDDLMLGLYERDNLAKDASLPPGPASPAEFSIGLPARSRKEVDELLRQAEAAGATLTAPAHLRPFGVYSGYFTDPDGHLFEIAWDSSRLRVRSRRGGRSRSPSPRDRAGGEEPRLFAAG